MQHHYLLIHYTVVSYITYALLSAEFIILIFHLFRIIALYILVDCVYFLMEWLTLQPIFLVVLLGTGHLSTPFWGSLSFRKGLRSSFHKRWRRLTICLYTLYYIPRIFVFKLSMPTVGWWLLLTTSLLLNILQLIEDEFSHTVIHRKPLGVAGQKGMAAKPARAIKRKGYPTLMPASSSEFINPFSPEIKK